MDSSELRIKSVERKINFILVIVSAQLLLSLATLLKETFLPSPITIVIVAVMLVGGIWLFRKPLLGLIKRKIVGSMLEEGRSSGKRPTVPGTDESIH